MKKFIPYTDKIIFLDTEFSSLDPYQGEILSIGLVKMNGEELYLELEHEGEVSDWVRENIIPYLTKEKWERDEALDKIKEFVGKDKPYFISYVTQYDAVYLRKLFELGEVSHDDSDQFPFHWLSIDFASILFALGIRPEDFTKNRKEFCSQFDVDLSKYQEHNALDDAKLLREIYLQMVANKNK